MGKGGGKRETTLCAKSGTFKVTKTRVGSRRRSGEERKDNAREGESQDQWALFSQSWRFKQGEGRSTYETPFTLSGVTAKQGESKERSFKP